MGGRSVFAGIVRGASVELKQPSFSPGGTIAVIYQTYSVLLKVQNPWAVVRTAYLRTINQEYEKTQVKYSTATCLALVPSPASP